MRKHLFLPVLAMLGIGAAAQATTITVTVENLAPANGTWLTPFWVGVHDGGYDTHTVGQLASPDLERIAEDGDGSFIQADFAAGSGQLQATIISDTGIPPLAPGEMGSVQLEVDGNLANGRYLSFLAMVIPSNDAFIGNDDPMHFEIFNGSGQFQGADMTLTGTMVKDAGTELNDELPAHTAFFGQASPDTGMTESMTIAMHGGYMAGGSGGVLDDPMFAAADFTIADYPLARIRVTRDVTTDAVEQPVQFELGSAFPNPFNPATTLSFSLAETAPVRLAVYNLAGQQVALLQEGLAERGEHQVSFDASAFASGVYLVALDSQGITQTQKIVLLK